ALLYVQRAVEEITPPFCDVILEPILQTFLVDPRVIGIGWGWGCGGGLILWSPALEPRLLGCRDVLDLQRCGYHIVLVCVHRKPPIANLWRLHRLSSSLH